MIRKIIVGLGNPGVEYENTRHNIGFTVLDALGEKYKISGKQEDKLLCWHGKGIIADQEVLLVWPTTFMNDSGKAIQKILNWFKVEPKDLIVVHDEVALDLGKIRVSFNSGAGGHHGIESTIQMLSGTEEFTRLRIGVGPDPGGDKRADYVLRKFSTQEEPFIKQVVNVSLQAIETIIMKDVGEAMNKFNGTEIKS